MNNRPETGHTDLSIVCATAEHVADIASFNTAMALETESLSLDADRVASGVRAVIENHGLGFYLVARIGNASVGCLMITSEWSDWRNGLFWWIQSVYVLPEHRGMGVYRRLYQEVRSRAKADGRICGIRLYVEKENRIAQSVYQNLGMRDSGYLVYESEPVEA